MESQLRLLLRYFDHAQIQDPELATVVKESEDLLVKSFYQSRWKAYLLTIVFAILLFLLSFADVAAVGEIPPEVVGLVLSLIGSVVIAIGLFRGPAEITALSFTGFVEGVPGNPTGLSLGGGRAGLVPYYESDVVGKTPSHLVFDVISRQAAADRTIQVLQGLVFLASGFTLQAFASLT